MLAFNIYIVEGGLNSTQFLFDIRLAQTDYVLRGLSSDLYCYHRMGCPKSLTTVNIFGEFTTRTIINEIVVASSNRSWYSSI